MAEITLLADCTSTGTNKHEATFEQTANLESSGTSGWPTPNENSMAHGCLEYSVLCSLHRLRMQRPGACREAAHVPHLVAVQSGACGGAGGEGAHNAVEALCQQQISPL